MFSSWNSGQARYSATRNDVRAVLPTATGLWFARIHLVPGNRKTPTANVAVPEDSNRRDGIKGRANDLGQISDNTYRFSLPNRTTAKDRMGLPIENFRQHVLQEMSAARQRGVTSPKPVVYEILNVDPESVVDIHEHHELRQNLLGAYEVDLVTNGDERLLGQRDELPAAFRQAKRWVGNNRKEAAGVLRVDAR